MGERLSAEDRGALDRSLEETGCHGFLGDHPELYAEVERIVAAAVAEDRERIATACLNAKGLHWKDREIAARIARGDQ